MAYDEGLAVRLRELLGERRDVFEKGMFGGLAFLIDGKMSVGIMGDDLLVRVGKARHEEALARPHARIMDFTRRPMPGWIIVASEGITEDDALADWVAWGVETATSPETKATRKPAPKRKSAGRPKATPKAKPKAKPKKPRPRPR
jgi:hypothetical protein